MVVENKLKYAFSQLLIALNITVSTHISVIHNIYKYKYNDIIDTYPSPSPKYDLINFV